MGNLFGFFFFFFFFAFLLFFVPEPPHNPSCPATFSPLADPARRNNTRQSEFVRDKFASSSSSSSSFSSSSLLLSSEGHKSNFLQGKRRFFWGGGVWGGGVGGGGKQSRLNFFLEFFSLLFVKSPAERAVSALSTSMTDRWIFVQPPSPSHTFFCVFVPERRFFIIRVCQCCFCARINTGSSFPKKHSDEAKNRFLCFAMHLH